MKRSVLVILFIVAIVLAILTFDTTNLLSFNNLLSIGIIVLGVLGLLGKKQTYDKYRLKSKAGFTFFRVMMLLGIMLTLLNANYNTPLSKENLSDYLLATLWMISFLTVLGPETPSKHSQENGEV